MKPNSDFTPRKARKAISIGVTMVITAAAALIVYGIVELALFNSRSLVAVESRTENVKAAAALMEFASAQLAGYLGQVPERADFATEAKKFEFMDASALFVGGHTAIGRGLIDTATKVVKPDGTSTPGTLCEVCAWPDAPLPTATVAASPVALTNGPAELKNVRSTVADSAFNSLDPLVGFAYSTSAYIPLRCRVIGMPDHRGERHNVYATALLWMRQGNLFRHTLYLNEVIYATGCGVATNFPGSIFSNKPMIYHLAAGGQNPYAQSFTGTFQFERMACPQFYVCPTSEYVNYATTGGYNALTGAFNAPVGDPNKKITQVAPVWMGRGNMDPADVTNTWTAFAKGIGFTSGVTALTADSRPLYLTRQDVAGAFNPGDVKAFWEPAGAKVTMLDSRNPDLMKTYAPAFNGSYTTDASGFQPVLPDGIATPSLARSMIEPPSLLNASGEPVAPAKPELPKPGARSKNPALWDQWAAYEKTSAADLTNAESAKYGNKAGLYVYVDTEGATTVFKTAKAAAAYKAASDKTAWLGGNADKVVKFNDPGVITTSNVFYDTTRINRAKNGTSLNGAPETALNSTDNGINTGTGDVTSLMDQSRVVRAVDIDMGALRKSLRTDGLVDGAGHVTGVGADWTGVMYVDVANPMATTTSTSTWGRTLDRLKTNLEYDVTDGSGNPVTDANGVAQVNKGVGFNGTSLATNIDSKFHQTAVRFYNATEIPDVSQTGADMPTPKSTVPGFTLATNAMAYSVGSVNADGDVSTYPSNTNAGSRENNATDSMGAAFHTPFALVCDNHQYISPSYQGDLDATKRLSTNRTAADNNIATVTNFKDAKGLAFGDLATLLSINRTGVDGTSGGTPKNPYTNQPIFKPASSIELTMALVCGSNDVQKDGNLQCGPSTVFNLDNNGSSTKYLTSGSTVVLFKTQYRTRQAPNGNNGYTWYSSPVNHYDPNLGRGYVAPGSPGVRSFRLFGFRLISEAEYNRLALPVASSVTAGGPTTP